MPSRSFSLYNPLLSIGPPVGTITLFDGDDKTFEATGDENGNNQSADIDGLPVTVNACNVALGPQVVVALVDGVTINISLTPVRVTIEDGLFDDHYIIFPGLPPGASLISVSLPLFVGDIAVPLCLDGDTPIKTPNGPIKARSIKAGDRILTKDHGVQPVRWVCLRHIDFTTDPEMEEFTPIVFEPHALGKNRPHKQIRVSPLHRMMVGHYCADLLFGEPEVLAFAKSLVNNDTIWIDRSCTSIDYVHILFDQHEVIFAAGAPVESLHPGKEALTQMDRQARDEVLALFPDLLNESSGYKTARPTLKHYEARVLADACFA